MSKRIADLTEYSKDVIPESITTLAEMVRHFGKEKYTSEDLRVTLLFAYVYDTMRKDRTYAVRMFEYLRGELVIRIIPRSDAAEYKNYLEINRQGPTRANVIIGTPASEIVATEYLCAVKYNQPEISADVISALVGKFLYE